MNEAKQNKELLYYEAYCLKSSAARLFHTNVVRTKDEDHAFFAYNCGREYLIRTYKENGKMFTEEWNPDKSIWQPSCTNCLHIDVCTDDTCAADGCDKYLHEDEIRILREFREEQERKRREGLVIDLPFPLGTPVFKITTTSDGPRVANLALKRSLFTYRDIPQVGKTVFPTTQEEEAKKAFQTAFQAHLKRIADQKEREKNEKIAKLMANDESQASPVFDYSDLMEEAKDRIEERGAIYGD